MDVWEQSEDGFTMWKQNIPSRFRPKNKRKQFTFYLLSTLILSTLSFLVAATSVFLYYFFSHPDFTSLSECHLNAYSTVYSEENEVISKLLLENRIPIPYERIPKPLIQAVIAAEDADFFHHNGINYRGIARALIKNLLAGRIVQGGSTITQQMIRILFLTPQRSLLRKIKEAAFACALERNMSKEQILFLYLNNIYLGNGAYGIEAASQSYFNKSVELLDLPEMAMLAGLVKAPSRSFLLGKRARQRQAYVLTRMQDLGFISSEDRERTLIETPKVQSKENIFHSKAPYFTQLIRQQVERKYGKEKIYQKGLNIYSTLNLSLQKAAQKSLEAGLSELDKRQGYRGPIRSLSAKDLKSLPSQKQGFLVPLPADQILEGVILSRDDSKELYTVWVENWKGTLPYTEMTWAFRGKRRANLNRQKVKNPSDMFRPGDVIHVRVRHPSTNDQPPVLSLDQKPLVQGALLCIDPRNGYVKAMVGGRNFSESQFNRVVHSRRQPGSAFKPLIYAAALEKGYTPFTILTDSLVKYASPDDGDDWAPKNYDRNFGGPIFLRDALALSKNVVTVKLLEDVGIGYVLQFIKKLGINSPIKRNLSIALGTSEVSMLELASAFAVFANGGEWVKPILIRKVVNGGGNGSSNQTEEREADEDRTPIEKRRILDPGNAFMMTLLLQGVVEYGTGQRAKALGRPVAGKTGTSGDYTDAWFIGYTPSLLVAVWVGFDDRTSLGENETGARAALPIWLSFMKKALSKTSIEDFKVPEGVNLPGLDIEPAQLASGYLKSIFEVRRPEEELEGKQRF